MIQTIAAVVAPACVGVIGLYLYQQRSGSPQDQQIAPHSNSNGSHTESAMNQATQAQSDIPRQGGLLASLCSIFRRRVDIPSQMRVIDSIALGPRDRVHVIEVGGSWFVVGQSSNGLSTLGMLLKGGAIAAHAVSSAAVTDKAAPEQIDLPERPAFKESARSSTELSIAPAAPVAALVQVLPEVHASHAPEVIGSMTSFLSALPTQPRSEAPHEEAADKKPVAAEPAPATLSPFARAAVAAEPVAVAPQSMDGVSSPSHEGGETSQVLAGVTVSPAAADLPTLVSCDADGFPDDVMEAVNAVANAEAAAEQTAVTEVKSVDSAVATEANSAKDAVSASQKSFLEMYSEVKEHGN